MLEPIYTELNSTTCSAKYNAKHYPEFYKKLMEKYPDAELFSERIYCYFNNIDIRPVCPICGGRLKYKNFKRGFSQYCSLKCCQNSPEHRNKIKHTNLLKYGTEYASQSQEVKDRVKKYSLDKYGVENPGATKEARQKAKVTTLKRFGTEYASQSQEVKDRVRETSLKRYGVNNYSSTKECKERVKKTNNDKYGGTGYASTILMNKINSTLIERYGTTNINENTIIKQKIHKSVDDLSKKNHPDIIDIYIDSDGRKCFRCTCTEFDKENNICQACKERQYDIYATVYSHRHGIGIPICTTKNPYSPIKDTSIERFIKEILDDYNIEYEENNRSILEGKELDIYIPEKHIAVECNGQYYHNSLNIPSIDYHHNKWLKCREKGIQLITVWEDQIIMSPQKVKSLILSKLGIYEQRIGARRCRIHEITSSESSTFIDKYHLQGNVNAPIRIGLFLKDELISVMTFGSKRIQYKDKGEQDEYELYRYCCKSGVQVIGGAERMLKYFITNYHPIHIVSYSSNDISTGDLYIKLGFSKSGETKASYWYIDKKTHIRYNRFTFTKQRLVEEGYDSNLTEEQIMYSRGFDKIYDSGTSKYIKTF